MDFVRSIRIIVGVHVGKIVAIAAGMGVTIVIMRSVRQAAFARFHGRSRSIYRKEVDSKRRDMFTEIHKLSRGDHTPMNIVEIGTAAVENICLYPTNAEITCITTHVYREKELLRLAEEYPYVNIERASPEAMTSLGDGTIDVVVSMLSLCTSRDAEKTLAEINRILKEGGRYYFIEHVAAKKLSLRSHIQNRYRFWWRMLFYGCTVDRRIYRTLKDFGFRKLDIDHFTADMDVSCERYLGNCLNALINRALVHMIGPHIIGVAVK